MTPNSSTEDKKHAEEMIKFFTTQLDDSDQKVRGLERKIEDLVKVMPKGNNSSWTLPELFELSTGTKVIAAGSVVLLVYLFVIREEKRK